MRFCSRCGRDEREAPIIRHLCVECYAKEHLPHILPRGVELVECPSCGGFRVGGDWISREEFGGDARVVIAHVLEEAKKVPEGFSALELENMEILEDEEGLRAVAFLRAVVSGREHRISSTVFVKKRGVLCPLCRAQRGGSYEAVLKIRGLPSMSPSLASRVERALSKLPEALRASIVEVERPREGVDLKLVSRHSAQAIAGMLRRDLGGRIVSSEEGEGLPRSSEKRPRLVLSLRIPDLREGVYIRIRGRPYVVEKVEEGHVVLSGRDGERVREPLERILREWRA